MSTADVSSCIARRAALAPLGQYGGSLPSDTPADDEWNAATGTYDLQ